MTWKTRTYSNPSEAIENACVGHLRGDFGSGKQFYTTWWPRHNGELVTDTFREELDATVNRLRENGMLKDLDTMREFVRQMANGALGEKYRNEYGYITQSDHHEFYIRCNPRQGNYNFYIYAYERSLLEQAMEQQNGLETELEPDLTMGEM